MNRFSALVTIAAGRVAQARRRRTFDLATRDLSDRDLTDVGLWRDMHGHVRHWRPDEA